MKTFDQMERDEKIDLYNDIERRKEVAQERTNSYIKKMSERQKSIVENLEGAQLEFKFPKKEEIKDKIAKLFKLK